jgi:hypothetical protein
LFENHTFFEHAVVDLRMDVRVCNHSDSPIAGLDLRIHLFELALREILWVEPKVLVSAVALVCILHVHPQDVEGVVLLCEVSVSLHHDVG